MRTIVSLSKDLLDPRPVSEPFTSLIRHRFRATFTRDLSTGGRRLGWRGPLSEWRRPPVNASERSAWPDLTSGAHAGSRTTRPSRILDTLKPVLRGGSLFLVLMAVSILIARQTALLDRHFIYFPEKDIVETPGDAGLEYEDVFFSASDEVSLHGWWVPGDGEITWLWFHGNAGNIGHRVDNLGAFVRRLGVNVFIFDYRGYGRSEGSPSEKGTYLDSEAALAYVRSRDDVDNSKLVLFGRSLGGAMAVHVAAQHDVYALILESPFPSIKAMARTHYPIPGVELLLRSKYDSLARIKDSRSPLMVLHGDRDQTVPLELGRQLFEEANGPKRFYTIQGADHNDTYVVGGDDYYDALRRFLADPTAD